MTPKRAKVTIRGPRGWRRSVWGECYGAYLAITPGDAFVRISRQSTSSVTAWTLTHRPTGYAIVANIPSIDEARKCAREAQKRGGRRWRFRNPEKPPKSVKPLGRRLQRFALQKIG